MNRPIINNSRDIINAIDDIRKEIDSFDTSITRLRSAKASICEPTDNQLLTWDEDLHMIIDSLWQLPAADGAANQVLYTDGAGTLGWVAPGAAAVAGADTQIQYNLAGVMGAEAAFTYNYNTNTMTVDSARATVDSSPNVADGATLGTAALEWSDAYFADSSVIYFGNDQDVTLTHIPDTSLSLNLSLTMVSTTSTVTGVIYKATDSFIHDFHHPVGGGAVPAGYNTFIGLTAGNFTMGAAATASGEASYNTGVGAQCLQNITLGRNLTAIAYRALRACTTGRDNTAIGTSALQNTTTGSYNSAIGQSALILNISGSYNNAIGRQALYSCTTGSSNCAFGSITLYNCNGIYNNAFGHAALYNCTGNYNNGFGYGAAYSVGNVQGNNAFGYYSLYSNATGQNNDAIGNLALRFITSGDYNDAIGYGAGQFLSGGGNHTTSNNSIFIGYDTRPSGNNETNQVVIGIQAIGLGSNTTVIGNTNTVTARIYGDIQIDSDTDGLILGDGQDVIFYFDGSDLIINSLNATANDEIHFTNFDFYVFDNPVMITNYKSGANQAAAGAAANELWVTNGHATQEDNTVMMGV